MQVSANYHLYVEGKKINKSKKYTEQCKMSTVKMATPKREGRGHNSWHQGSLLEVGLGNDFLFPFVGKPIWRALC